MTLNNLKKTFLVVILFVTNVCESEMSEVSDVNEENFEHHPLDEFEFVTESTFQADKCSCNNGECVEENGKQVCKCNPEYGLYNPGDCRACDCGKNMNCTFKAKILISKTKTCICSTGYVETAGKCKGGCRLNPCRKGRCEDGPGTKFKCICPEGYLGVKCEIKDLCSSNPCQNGGTCSMIGDKMNCTCPVPFSGNNCERTPCTRNPCKNGGTCSVTSTGFKCSCRGKYTGAICNLAPCNINPCKNGGTCEITPTGYNCSCRSGFGGDNCTSTITPCTSNPCKNGGICAVKGKDFQCSCKEPYSGKTCETSPCSINPCLNSGNCTVSGLTYKCNCPKPYSGGKCDISPCASNPCKNSGTCKVTSTGFNCTCKAPYSGTLCEKGPCTKNPCLNNGNCTVSSLSFKCSCPKPYSGEKCEIKDCHCINGYCVKENGDLKCVCNSEFGLYDEHECKECKCGKGANCTFDKGIIFDDIICICPKGYEVKGEKCIAIDPCLSHPCQQGGICSSHEIEYKCNCPPGYSGDNCENDPCFPKPCLNEGTCSVTGSTFNCACKAPFFGNKCENDSCTAKPCKNDGTCTPVSRESFNCNCKVPFSGKTCEDDPCTKNPCHNGGKCKIAGDAFKCECKKPYFGDVCSNDPCTESPCKNGGTCKLADESYKCECKKPFYGDQCEKEECLCENGKCIDTENGLKCVCNPEYGLYKEGVCKACNCGPRANCTFDVGLIYDDILCICPEGYKVNGEKCILDFTTATTSEITSALPSTLVETSETTMETTVMESTTETAKTTDATLSETDISTKAKHTPSSIANTVSTITRTVTGDSDSTTKQSTATTQSQEQSTPIMTSTDLTQQTNSVTETKTGNSSTDQLQRETTSLSSDASSTIATVFTNENTDSTSKTLPNNTTTPDDIIFPNSTPSLVSMTDTEVNNLTSVSVTDTIYTTILLPDPCRPNPCYNGGTCQRINHMSYCFCRYPYGGRFCREGEWCVDSWGATLCPHNCNFNFSTNVGRCVCEIGELYNHNTKECEVVDMCPYMSDQCTGKNEICSNSTCQCEENFERNDKNECVPNFCKTKFNPCGVNTICEDVVDEPKHMKCLCKEGYTSIGKGCQKVNKCNIPGLLHCQHICNTTTESCDCLPGYELLPDGISCELVDQNATCTKDCGVGVCRKNEGDEECICPLTYTWNGTTCIDLCTADYNDSGICPGGRCIHDDLLGFKCLCKDPFPYNNDNVTCGTKSMCHEGNGTQACAEIGATCWDNFDELEGYRCLCAEDQAMDIDGKCKNKCELKENQDHCANKQGRCITDGSRIKCVCPPLVTQDTEGNCNKLAEFSYIVSFPLVRDKYISTVNSSRKAFNAETRDTVNNAAVAKDVDDTLKFLFGQYYDTSKIFQCSDSPTNNLLRCQVEVQFHGDPKDQTKIIQDEGSCTSNNGSQTCILPPRLLLQKSLIRPDMITDANPCAPAFKKINCGPATECMKVDNKTKNFICTCSSGFQSYGLYYPFVDERTVVHRCEDIDECKLPNACPDRTKCSNTYGSYECTCIDGYQPTDITKDPKIVGCSSICSSKTCNHGKCDVSGKQFYCKCDEGYIGKYCDQALNSAPTVEAGSMKIALIILSTMIIPLVLFSIYIFVKYRTFKKSASESGYFDDRSSLTMNMVPIDVRVDNSDIPS